MYIHIYIYHSQQGAGGHGEKRPWTEAVARWQAGHQGVDPCSSHLLPGYIPAATGLLPTFEVGCSVFRGVETYSLGCIFYQRFAMKSSIDRIFQQVMSALTPMFCLASAMTPILSIRIWVNFSSFTHLNYLAIFAGESPINTTVPSEFPGLGRSHLPISIYQGW